jgi:hypothetical protein
MEKSKSAKRCDVALGLCQSLGVYGVSLLVSVAPLPLSAAGKLATTAAVVAVVGVNVILGVCRVMEACFGEDGLLCDLDRRLTLACLRRDREEGDPVRRFRLTNPSEALRKRGATRRQVKDVLAAA